MTLRLVLVDDHPVVRAGLRALVESQDDLRVVGEAGGADQAVQVVQAEHPDVVLMDLSMGEGPGGIEATARLRALSEPPTVLVLTTYDSESDILRALDAGAGGYLLKDSPPDQLFAGIRAVAAGQPALAPSVAAVLMRRAASPEPRMTEREVEVLELLADGLGNRELAKVLFVSEATVKSHLSHIYTKLGVDTRAGAVAAAIEQRIIRR
ncbi:MULTISPECIES: response regulator transcription factor [unclassified Microbacterium]|uniref:response regulator n=1 Tax=unclassified Microbacterium TaxID=2609290 RepID=UPI0012F72559|nr:response regulator transcription factor [Microbacterium sp. MAH-37]MVQ41592.1 response regulator [Microbacterium sp. MAH-37]